jgi:hypothetical protein
VRGFESLLLRQENNSTFTGRVIFLLKKTNNIIVSLLHARLRSDVKDPVPVNPHEALVLDNVYYCKNPAGLRKVVTELRRFGYDVAGARFTEPRPLVPPDEFQRRCVPQWNATLPGVSMAQCLTCQGVIDPTDVDVDEGRPCEFCGTSTMRPSKQPGAAGELTWNIKFIMFWRGKIYPHRQDVRGALKYPIRVQVYEAWRWTRLQPSPELAHHVLQRVGYMRASGQYDADETCQDMPGRLHNMDLFVRDFTTISYEAWRTNTASLLNENRLGVVRAALLPLLTG